MYVVKDVVEMLEVRWNIEVGLEDVFVNWFRRENQGCVFHSGRVTGVLWERCCRR